MSDPVPPSSRPLEGLRGLVLGVANEHSIAWGCARVLAERGARLALTCLNEKSVPMWRRWPNASARRCCAAMWRSRASCRPP